VLLGFQLARSLVEDGACRAAVDLVRLGIARLSTTVAVVRVRCVAHRVVWRVVTG